MIVESIKSAQADILALPEINTPWIKDLGDKVWKIGRKVCGSFKCVGTSSDDPGVGKYQPGGVALLTQ
eukprot:9060130-Ditylum_brightwellii.AAC.1